MVDTQLESIGIYLSTSIAFTAVRDSVYRAELVVPTANDYVAERCIHDAIWYSDDATPARAAPCG